MNLFRPEASRGLDTLHGEVSLVPPISWQLLGVFLAVSLAVAATFLSFARYAKVSVATGTVTGDKGVVRIAPSRAGTFDRLLVEEGQRVKAGAPLAHVEIATSDQTGSLQVRRAEALTRQEDELATRLRDVRASGTDRVASLEAQIAGDEREVADLREQAVQERELVAVAREDVAKIEDVARRGLVSGHELRVRREQVTLREQALTRLAQEAGERTTAVAVARADIARARAETESEVSAVAATRAELDRSAAGDDIQGGLVLRAPIDGTVTAIVVHAGDPATPSSAAMTLLPAGTRVEATLAAPASAAGLLEVGQPVRIAVDAFPYQTYGALDGVVRTISKTTEPVAGRTASEAFLVRATLPPTVKAYGVAHPLRPGMTLTARIRTQPRTLVAWLFDPVLAVRRR